MGRPRRRQQRGAFYGEPNGLQPGDDVGNRRSLRQTQHPPDDIGNRAETAESQRLPDDNVGNRIDAAPTHEVSGVLADIDGRRRRKKKGGGHQRVGRYIMGGVNPVVAGHPERAIKALEEADQRRYEQRSEQRPQERPPQRPEGGPSEQGPGAQGLEGDEEGRRGRRRRRRRRDGRDQVDGVAAQEVSERRAQRFFDFEEDDRFEYVLKSSPESKRKDAENAVRSVLESSGRDAVVLSRVLDDGDKPKVLITIDERGPKQDLPEARRPESASEPLFVLGNAALMSLNYLANKIVNRYPEDRIRLAILPKADEALYLKALAEHREQHPHQDSAAGVKPNGAAGAAAPAPGLTAAAAPVPAEAPVSGEPLAEAPAPVQEAEAPAEEAPKKKAARARPRSKVAVAPEEALEPVDAVEETAAPAEQAGVDEAEAAAPKKKAVAKKAAKTAKVGKVAKTAAAKAPAAKTPAKKSVAKKATKKAPAKKTTSKAKPASKKDE